MTLIPLLAPAIGLMVPVGVALPGFVGFYALHDTFGGNRFFRVGLDWPRAVLGSAEFRGAMARSAGFAALALAVLEPPRLWIAPHMPG